MLLLFLAAASVAPVQSPQSWFSTADYPAAAVEKNAEGTVGVDLSVSPSGIPIDCRVTSPASEPSLNEQTCAVLLKNARFSTSSEAASQEPSHYKTVVKWALDNLKLNPIAFGSISEFSVSNNKIVNCRERLFGDENAGLSDACEGINGGPKEALEYLMDTHLGDVSKGALRLYVEPVGENNIEVVPPNTARIATLARADFDVLPTGKVGNCRMVQISGRLPQKDLCKLINSPETRFKAPPAGRTIQMRVMVDLWVS